MFGYDAEQGAKAFCIAEMFIGYLHTLVVICIMRLPVTEYFKHALDGTKPKFSATQTILFVIYTLFTFGLLVQAVCGILLYFIGFKKKNITMLRIWMGVAAFNFSCPPFLTGLAIFGKDDLADNVLPGSVGWVLLYMLYIDIGLSTICNYVKHLRKTAPATSVEAAEAGGPDDSKDDGAPKQSEKSVVAEA